MPGVEEAGDVAPEKRRARRIVMTGQQRENASSTSVNRGETSAGNRCGKGYSSRVSSLAITSSMMAAGTFSTKAAPRRCRSRMRG
jgi:hypothetical protein